MVNPRARRFCHNWLCVIGNAETCLTDHGEIIRAIALAQSPAAALNITGAGIHRVRDIAEDFAKLFGTQAIIEGTEAPTAWLNDARYSHSLFGKPETSLKTMEQWIAAWLCAGGNTWGKPTGFEKRDGNF